MSHQNEQGFTDQELVQRVLKGDKRAFELIIHHTERLVAGMVCDLVKGAEDQKDIIQETYIQAYHKLGSFEFKCKLSTWIAQIAYNGSISFLRKKKLLFPGELLAAAETIQSDTNLISKDISAIIKMEIEALPEIYKMLIGLFHQQELSYTEIINITGLPMGTVKNYLFRARKALKENLLSNYEKEAL